jgi:hypothetical protein
VIFLSPSKEMSELDLGKVKTTSFQIISQLSSIHSALYILADESMVK